MFVGGASNRGEVLLRGAVLPGRKHERSEASLRVDARTTAQEDRTTIARTAAQETSSYDSYLRPAGMLQLFSSASMRIVDWYTFDCLKSVAAT